MGDCQHDCFSSFHPFMFHLTRCVLVNSSELHADVCTILKNIGFSRGRAFSRQHLFSSVLLCTFSCEQLTRCFLFLVHIHLSYLLVQGMVFVQMLSELEEVVLYKTRPEKQPVIRKIWWDRLQVRTHPACLLQHLHLCSIMSCEQNHLYFHVWRGLGATPV